MDIMRQTLFVYRVGLGSHNVLRIPFLFPHNEITVCDEYDALR